MGQAESSLQMPWLLAPAVFQRGAFGALPAEAAALAALAVPTTTRNQQGENQ
jgi:hypothetical protein